MRIKGGRKAQGQERLGTRQSQEHQKLHYHMEDITAVLRYTCKNNIILEKVLI